VLRDCLYPSIILSVLTMSHFRPLFSGLIFHRTIRRRRPCLTLQREEAQRLSRSEQGSI